MKLRNEGEGRRILSLTDGRNLIGLSSKDEPSHRRRKRDVHVFSANLSLNLDVGTIASTDDEGAVQSEFHVTRR